MKLYEELKKKLNFDNAYLLEERAAIMEFDGNISREEAENKAMELWYEHIASKSSSRMEPEKSRPVK